MVGLMIKQVNKKLPARPAQENLNPYLFLDMTDKSNAHEEVFTFVGILQDHS
jgi:hypothetical protein